jgi:hypothetical protein
MTAIFQTAIFNDDVNAREALEAVRWPNGPICPTRTGRLTTKSYRSAARKFLR